jgi:peroxiredoxin
MTQLVELQEALPKFQAAGIKLYAVSYDEADALAEFARHHGITYPLLADKGSKLIRQLGIQNHFVTKDQVPYYGIPFPGTYLIDEDGVVTAKFFQRNLARRESAETVIDSALGRVLLGQEEPFAEAGDDDIRVTATYHGGGGRLKAGVVRQIVVRFELAAGLHLYDEPVPDGMVATKIRIEGPPGLHADEPTKPPTKPLELPGLDVELHVWSGRVDFVVPVWADDRIAGIVSEIAHDAIPIGVRVDYQACDDRTCRIPRSETLEVIVPVAPYVGHDLPGKLRGTVATTMDVRKFMLRKIRRGLLRSPIKGFRYLKQTLQHTRRGPAGRRDRVGPPNETSATDTKPS